MALAFVEVGRAPIGTATITGGRTMSSVKRAGLMLTAVGLVGGAASAPSAEAQARYHGPRFVYTRPTGHGWYGYPGYYAPYSPYFAFGLYAPFYGPYYGPGPYPYLVAPGADLNDAAIHGLGAVELNTKP